MKKKSAYNRRKRDGNNSKDRWSSVSFLIFWFGYTISSFFNYSHSTRIWCLQLKLVCYLSSATKSDPRFYFEDPQFFYYCDRLGTEDKIVLSVLRIWNFIECGAATSDFWVLASGFTTTMFYGRLRSYSETLTNSSVIADRRQKHDNLENLFVPKLLEFNPSQWSSTFSRSEQYQWILGLDFMQ